MNIVTKTKPAIHLKQNDVLVLTNQTSKVQSTHKVVGLNFSEDEKHFYPVRVVVATPNIFEKKASRDIGYNYRDNVEVVA